MRLGRAALVLTAALALAAPVGCGRESGQQHSGATANTSVEPTAALPPALTAGEPLESVWDGPRGPGSVSGAEAQRRYIRSSVRHANLPEAANAVGFTPRLPKYPRLQYLLTSSGLPMKYFTAWYDDGKLVITETLGPSALKGPWSERTVTGKLRGHDASVITTLAGDRLPDRVPVADLFWWEDEVNFHVQYEGPLDEAVKIAESIPNR